MFGSHEVYQRITSCGECKFYDMNFNSVLIFLLVYGEPTYDISGVQECKVIGDRLKKNNDLMKHVFVKFNVRRTDAHY